MGLYHLRLGRLDEARRYLDGATTAHDSRLNIAAVSASYLGLAAASLERGDHPAAETALSKALDIARRGGNVLFECWVLPVLAELYLVTGDREATGRMVARGFELLGPGEDWRGLPAPLHLARAMLAAAEQRWDDAERDFETALSLNRRYTLPFDEAKTLAAWGRMHLARAAAGDQECARERLGNALAIFERVQAAREVDKVRTALEPLRA